MCDVGIVWEEVEREGSIMQSHIVTIVMAMVLNRDIIRTYLQLFYHDHYY